MLISQLDVVNGCLATMGEAPLNSLDDDHSYKAAALAYLQEMSLTEQGPGFWFNAEEIILVPDANSKFIYVPQDAIALRPDRKLTHPFAQRGRRLYDTGKNTYEWDNGVFVTVVRALDFEDLPFHAANLVRYSAILRFQSEYDGDNARFQQIGGQFARAKAELTAENTRNYKPNLLARRSAQSIMARVRPQMRFAGPFIPTHL